MKKISLIGALWTNNFGDLLLARLFADKVAVKCAVPVFPSIDRNVASEIGLARCHQGISEFFKSDAAIFVGGGYMSESPSRPLKWAISRWLRIFIYGDMCRILNKPYLVCSVGAGPATTWFAKAMFRRLCAGAVEVVVRDHYSYAFLKDIGVERELLVTADYALTLPKFSSNENADGGIALHLTSKQSELNENIIRTLRHVLQPGRALHFIEDHPGEYERVCSVNPSLNSLNLTRVVRYKNYRALVEELKNIGTVITSKLHVGIVAAVNGRRICSFPYHPKVWRFYEELERPELCYSGAADSFEHVSEHIRTCLNSAPVILPEALLNRLNVAEKSLGDFIDSIVKENVTGKIYD